jgi:adenylate cyclase
LVALGGGLLLASTMLVHEVGWWVMGLDRRLGDQMLQRPGGPPERGDLVFLGIDDASLTLDSLDPERVAGDPVLSMMANRFPWDRRVHAAAIERLMEAGARLVVMDLVMSEPSEPEADEALAAVIEKYRDRMVLASVLTPVLRPDGSEEFSMKDPLDLFFGDMETPTRVGYVNFRPHALDHLVREARYVTTHSQENGREPLPGETEYRSLAAEVIDALGGEVPKGTKGLRFHVRDRRTLASEIYQPISYHSLFVEEDWRFRYGGGEWFKGKVVMIGPAAARFQDAHRTPVGLLGGPQLHLQAVACGMAGAFVERPFEDPSFDVWQPWPFWMAVCGAVAAGLGKWLVKRPMVGFISALVVVGAVGAGFYLLADLKGVMLGVVGFIAAFGLGTGAGQSYDLVTERLEKGRLHRQFRRFVSRDVADVLVQNPGIYQTAAAGRKRRVVVLFSDVRGFTARSERSDPRELVGQLNEYLTEMVSIVFKHSGTLDKFIGDAVMAHWGALEDGSEAVRARQSIEGGKEMIERLAALNAGWTAGGRELFKIGIGVHLGEAVAGEIGSPEKTEFGVIGDAVNLASRIEGLTKAFGSELLVSESVVEAAGLPEEMMRKIARVRVKGRETPVTLYGLAGGGAGEARYAEALGCFEAGDFRAAVEGFREVLRVMPGDGPAGRLLEWAEGLIVEPPANWDGVMTMLEK